MITDYDSLKADVASQLARSNITSDSASVETDIALAEGLINRKLRVVQMEEDTTITCVATEDSVDLPDNYLEQRNLEFNSAPRGIKYLPLTKFKNLKIYTGASRPLAYTSSNNKTNRVQALKFAPTPDDNYALTLTYYSKIPALSDSNTTNWLLSYDPELYLNTSLYFAFRRLRNSLAGEYLTLSQNRINEMNDEEQMKKLGPSGTRISVRGNVV